jgi:sec-independent protein translocase protein TatB
MFDIGFSELMVIGVVALIVIGPQRLPRVARTAGLLFGRLQRYVAEVKADINREIELDELRKLQSTMQDTAKEIEQSVSSQMQYVENEVKQAEQDTRETVQQAVAPMSGISLLPDETPAAAERPPKAGNDETPASEPAADGKGSAPAVKKQA